MRRSSAPAFHDLAEPCVHGVSRTPKGGGICELLESFQSLASKTTNSVVYKKRTRNLHLKKKKSSLNDWPVDGTTAFFLFWGVLLSVVNEN